MSSSALGNASADEWELVGEQKVYLEIEGVVDIPNDIQPGECQLINADSEKPLFKVGDFVYTGRYEDTLGSHLAFRVDSCPTTGPSSSSTPASSDTASATRKLQLAGKTNKSLKMAPACIRSKESTEDHEETKT